MKVSATGVVSRGFFPEVARHLSRVFDVPEGGGYVGGRGGGWFSPVERGEVVVFWRDWTSQTHIAPRGDLRFDWGRRARWREARELGRALLSRHSGSRWVEPILADEFTRQIVRRLPAHWHLSDEALGAWWWRFELRRWEYFGPDIWRAVQRDLSQKRARCAIKPRR